jgi:hypothetical protein
MREYIREISGWKVVEVDDIEEGSGGVVIRNLVLVVRSSHRLREKSEPRSFLDSSWKRGEHVAGAPSRYVPPLLRSSCHGRPLFAHPSQCCLV